MNAAACWRPRPPLTLLLGGVLSAGALWAGESPADAAFFRDQVKPLLDARCIDCHGPDKAKAGLRLDSRAAIIAGGERGPAAVPGKPADSLLVKAAQRKGDLAMPPKTPLPAGEAAILATWVERGMPWPGQTTAAPTAPAPVAPAAPEPDEAATAFFEKSIRPLLKARCFECHGTNEPKAGLQLTSRFSIVDGGDSGPAAVPGRPQDSLLIKAISHQGDLKMPKGGKALTADEVAALTKWVAMGLPWPKPSKGISIVAAQGGTFTISPEQRAWWSFQPMAKPSPPAVADAAWPKDDLDRFVLAKLEARGLKPAPPADPGALLRRATFDLTGLPPTPEELDAFLADRSPDAFAKVVDRLLASPRYGERWARHWLDGVRYADTLSYEGFQTTDNISWPYRDWVVRALNRDLPYDQFVARQLAGDLLPAKDDAERIDNQAATGLLAMGVWMDQDTEREKTIAEIVDQQIDLVGRTFMGVTLACARCHNHKFDPISTADYYGLAGIFFSTRVTLNDGRRRKPFLLGSAAEVAAYEKAAARIRDIEKRIKDAEKGRRRDAKAADPPELAALRAELKPLKDIKRPLQAVGAEDGGLPDTLHDGIGDTRIYLRGNYKTQGDVVPRRFPVALAGERQPTIPGTTSGRRELAAWLTRADHPLTARVMVNRVWHHHVGAGIARTPGNLGKQGEKPTHPELLDHLAQRFIAGGWSLKALHRAILLSATYRQSALGRAETVKADPDNLLIGRMNRRRLEAEAVRDALLAVGGRLDTAKVGGAPGTGGVRSLFLPISRREPNDLLALFDGADPGGITDRREVSTSAPQALFLLNNGVAVGAGQGLAERARSKGGDIAAQVRTAYRIAYARDPSAAELKLASDFLAGGDAKGGAWAQFAHALVCANEFIFVE